MLNNVTILLIIVLLSACATPQEPTVKIVTQTVEIPIPIKCKVEVPIQPDYCFYKLDEGNDIFDKTKCVLSDRQLSKAYELQLLAALQSCK